MVGHPCNRADSALRAHIWQVVLNQRNGPWLAPPFPPGVSTHSRTMMAKTEHTNPEMTHLFTNLSSSPATVKVPATGGTGVTPESHRDHTLPVNPLLNYHSQKMAKSVSVKSLWNEVEWQTGNILTMSCPPAPDSFLPSGSSSTWNCRRLLPEDEERLMVWPPKHREDC